MSELEKEIICSNIFIYSAHGDNAALCTEQKTTVQNSIINERNTSHIDI